MYDFYTLYYFFCRPRAPFSIRHWCHRYSDGPFVFFVCLFCVICWKLKHTILIIYYHSFCLFSPSSIAFPLLIRINSIFIWYSNIVLWILFLWFSCAVPPLYLRPFCSVSSRLVISFNVIHSHLVHGHKRCALKFFNENSNKLIMINLLDYVFQERFHSSALFFHLFLFFPFFVFSQLKSSMWKSHQLFINHLMLSVSFFFVGF